MAKWHQRYTELVLLLFCYSCGELGHYLLAVTSKPIAQDVEFGDQGCMAENESYVEDYQVKCSEISNQTKCELESNISSYCKWDYEGRGLEYQLLAGPTYVVIFTIMGIVFGVLGDKYNRIRLLTFSVFFFSIMTFTTGFAQEYWQLVALRFGFGAGESACAPLASSLIAGKYPSKNRAKAIGIFNWGIYLGYGLSFAVGNALQEADLLGKGWRVCYILTGVVGFIFAALLGVFGRDKTQIFDEDFVEVKGTIPTSYVRLYPPKIGFVVSKPRTSQSSDINYHKDTLMGNYNFTDKESTEDERITYKFRRVMALSCCSFTVPFLLTGACFRHSASFCWSYSAQNYFDTYYPGTKVGLFMSVTSIVGGSIGIVIGGLSSDWLVQKYGISKRLWILVISQAIASPFAAGVLLLQPPIAFVSLLLAYFFAEMWYGVFLTILTEFYPKNMRATAVACVIFLINNVGGNAQLLVPPLSGAIGFREALLVLYPGFYFTSAVFFMLAELTLLLEEKKVSTKTLIPDDQQNEISAL